MCSVEWGAVAENWMRGERTCWKFVGTPCQTCHIFPSTLVFVCPAFLRMRNIQHPPFGYRCYVKKLTNGETEQRGKKTSVSEKVCGHHHHHHKPQPPPETTTTTTAKTTSYRFANKHCDKERHSCALRNDARGSADSANSHPTQCVVYATSHVILGVR